MKGRRGRRGDEEDEEEKKRRLRKEEESKGARSKTFPTSKPRKPAKESPTKLPTKTSPTKRPTKTSPTKLPTKTSPTKLPTKTSPTKRPTKTSPTKRPTKTSPTKLPTKTSPTKLPTKTSPTKPSKDSPTKPSKDSTTKPSKDSTTKPSKDSTTKPSKDSPTKPTKDSPTKPTKGSPTKPSKDSPTKPSKDSTTKPSKDSTTKPSKDSTTKPSKDSTTKPTKDSPTKPTKGSPTKPSKDSPTKPSKDSPTKPSPNSPPSDFRKNSPKEGDEFAMAWEKEEKEKEEEIKPLTEEAVRELCGSVDSSETDARIRAWREREGSFDLRPGQSPLNQLSDAVDSFANRIRKFRVQRLAVIANRYRSKEGEEDTTSSSTSDSQGVPLMLRIPVSRRVFRYIKCRGRIPGIGRRPSDDANASDDGGPSGGSRPQTHGTDSGLARSCALPTMDDDSSSHCTGPTSPAHEHVPREKSSTAGACAPVDTEGYTNVPGIHIRSGWDRAIPDERVPSCVFFPRQESVANQTSSPLETRSGSSCSLLLSEACDSFEAYEADVSLSSESSEPQGAYYISPRLLRALPELLGPAPDPSSEVVPAPYRLVFKEDPPSDQTTGTREALPRSSRYSWPLALDQTMPDVTCMPEKKSQRLQTPCSSSADSSRKAYSVPLESHRDAISMASYARLSISLESVSSDSSEMQANIMSQDSRIMEWVPVSNLWARRMIRYELIPTPLTLFKTGQKPHPPPFLHESTSMGHQQGTASTDQKPTEIGSTDMISQATGVEPEPGAEPGPEPGPEPKPQETTNQPKKSKSPKKQPSKLPLPQKPSGSAPAPAGRPGKGGVLHPPSGPKPQSANPPRIQQGTSDAVAQQQQPRGAQKNPKPGTSGPSALVARAQAERRAAESASRKKAESGETSNKSGKKKPSKKPSEEGEGAKGGGRPGDRKPPGGPGSDKPPLPPFKF